MTAGDVRCDDGAGVARGDGAVSRANDVLLCCLAADCIEADSVYTTDTRGREAAGQHRNFGKICRQW